MIIFFVFVSLPVKCVITLLQKINALHFLSHCLVPFIPFVVMMEGKVCACW